MKESTKKVFKLHGWRVDRAIHNYIYFTFYDLYVKIALNATKATMPHTTHAPPTTNRNPGGLGWRPTCPGGSSRPRRPCRGEDRRRLFGRAMRVHPTAPPRAHLDR